MPVTGVERLQEQLSSLARKRLGLSGAPSVITGYTANYAVYVHENLEARHEQGKSAKFLEIPARELRNSGYLQKQVLETIRGGGTLTDGLKVAALAIQAESQKIVPVSGWDPNPPDGTGISPPGPGMGNLKQSAFTRVENE